MQLSGVKSYDFLYQSIKSKSKKMLHGLIGTRAKSSLPMKLILTALRNLRAKGNMLMRWISFKFTDTLWIYIKGISFAWSTYLNTAIAFTSSRLEYVQNNTAQFVGQRSRSLILPYQNYQVTQGHGGLACLKTHDPISFNTYRREDDYCCRMP